MRNLNSELSKFFDTLPGVLALTDPTAMMRAVAAGCDGLTDVAKIDLFRKTVNPNPTGEAWCADFLQSLIAYAELKTGKSSFNIAVTESARNLWTLSKNAFVVQTPEPGDLIIWGVRDSWQGHCGIITGSDSLLYYTVEGNTTPYGQAGEIQREGLGVYAKKRAKRGSKTFLELGFLRPFP